MLRAKGLVMKLSAARKAAWSPRAAGMALVALLAAMASAPAGGQQYRMIGGREVRLVPARPLDTVVARSTLGELTIADLRDYYRWFRPPIAPPIPYTTVPEMPRTWIAQLSGTLALSLALEKEADELAAADPAARGKYEKQFKQLLLNYAIDEMTERRVTSRLAEPTDEEILAYYEAHKPEFFQPFEFYMRHIFMMTYVPYVVLAGDTLESIAEKQTGDRAQVANIRSDAPGRPARWVPRDERANKLFKPLDVGEALLVPMNEEKAAQVKARLEAVLQRLDEDKSFEELGNSYSEAVAKGSVIGPLPTGVRSHVKPLLDAGRSTPINEPSPIFRTRHGFQTILVTQRTDEGFRPVEDVRAQIVEILIEEQTEKLQLELSDELFSLPQLTIHYETIEKAPDLSDETPVVSIGEDRIYWSDFKRDWESRLGPEASREQILTFMRYYNPAQLYLTLAWCEQNGVFEEPDLKRAYRAVRTGSYGKTRMGEKIGEQERAAATEEKVKAYYEENKESRYTLLPRVSYQVVERRPGPRFDAADEREKGRILKRMAKDLAVELNKLRTIDDFIDLAGRTNQMPGPANPNLNIVGTPLAANDIDETLLSGPTGREVLRLRIGRWSEPYEEEGTVRAVALTRREETTVRPLDEVRASIQDRLKAEVRRGAQAEITKKTIEEIEYEFLLPADEQ